MIVVKLNVLNSIPVKSLLNHPIMRSVLKPHRFQSVGIYESVQLNHQIHEYTIVSFEFPCLLISSNQLDKPNAIVVKDKLTICWFRWLNNWHTFNYGASISNLLLIWTSLVIYGGSNGCNIKYAEISENENNNNSY